jgi:hypothetical protein
MSDAKETAEARKKSGFDNSPLGWFEVVWLLATGVCDLAVIVIQ